MAGKVMRGVSAATGEKKKEKVTSVARGAELMVQQRERARREKLQQERTAREKQAREAAAAWEAAAREKERAAQAAYAQTPKGQRMAQRAQEQREEQLGYRVPKNWKGGRVLNETGRAAAWYQETEDTREKAGLTKDALEQARYRAAQEDPTFQAALAKMTKGRKATPGVGLDSFIRRQTGGGTGLDRTMQRRAAADAEAGRRSAEAEAALTLTDEEREARAKTARATWAGEAGGYTLADYETAARTYKQLMQEKQARMARDPEERARYEELERAGEAGRTTLSDEDRATYDGWRELEDALANEQAIMQRWEDGGGKESKRSQTEAARAAKWEGQLTETEELAAAYAGKRNAGEGALAAAKALKALYTRRAEVYRDVTALRGAGDGGEALHEAEQMLALLDDQITASEYAMKVFEPDFAQGSVYREGAGNTDYRLVNGARLTAWDMSPLSGNWGRGSDIQDERFMTAQEKRIYTYTYNKEGEEAATAYLKVLRPRLQKRAAQAEQQRVATLASTPAGAWGMSAVTALTTPMEGIGYAAAAAGKLLGRETSPYDWTFRAGMNKSAVRETVKEGQRAAFGDGWGGDVANLIYDVAMTSADSAVSMGMGGVLGAAAGGAAAAERLGSLLMAGASATGKTQEALLLGREGTTALEQGFFSGLTEYLTEHMGSERLVEGFRAGKGGKYATVLSNMVKGFIPEAVEEAPGNVVDALVDDWLNGESSGRNEGIREKMRAGMTLDEAVAAADAEFLTETLQGMLVGGLSGGLSVGVSTATGVIGAKRTARELTQSGVDARTAQTAAETLAGLRTDEAGKAAVDAAAAQLQFKEDAKGTKHAPFQAAATVEGFDSVPVQVVGVDSVDENGEARVVMQRGSTAEEKTAADGVEYSVQDDGQGGKIAVIDRTAAGFAPLRTPKEVTTYLKRHIGELYQVISDESPVYLGKDLPKEYARSKSAARLRATDKETYNAKNDAAQEIGDILTLAQNGRHEETRHPGNKDAELGMYRYDIRFIVQDADGATGYKGEMVVRHAKNGEKYLYDIVNVKKNTHLTTYSGRLPGAARGRAEAPKPSGSAEGSIAQAAEKSNRTSVPLSQLHFADADTAEAYRLAAKLGDAQAARQYLAGYEATTLPIGVYNRAFQSAYDAGRNGRNMTEYERTQGYGRMLSETVRQIAYNAGKAATAAQNVRLSLPAEVEGDMRTRLSKLPRTYTDGYAGVVYQAKTTRPTAAQAVMLDLLNEYGKEHGVHYTVVDTLGNGSNGVYTGADGGMVIALDAQEGYLTRVGTHEGWHYIKENVREEAQGLQQYVLTLLESTEGYDLEGRIAEKQRQYKEAVGQELNRDAALEELTADALYDAIATPENLAKIAPRYPKAVEKFMDFINGFVKEIRAIMRRISGKNPEVRAMLEHEAAEAEDIIAEYNRLMEKAAEAEKKNHAREGTGMEQYQLRDSDGNVISLSEQEMEERRKKVANMQAVAEVLGNRFEKNENADFATMGEAYFKEIGGMATNPILGEVKLDRKGIDHLIGRKLTARKAALLEAVKPVIEQGEIIYIDNRHKGTYVDTAIIAAPVKLNRELYYMGCVVRQTGQMDNSYALHDAVLVRKFDEEKQKGGTVNPPSKLQADPANGLTNPSVASILASLANYNTEFTDKSTSEQFSLRDIDVDTAEMQRVLEENRTLTDMVGALQGQMQRLAGINEQLRQENSGLTGEHRMDYNQVRDLARAMKEKYESKVSVNDLAYNLQAAFNQMLNARDGAGSRAAMTAMGAVVRDMLTKSQRTDTTMYEAYKGMRDYLRKTPMRLTEAQWQEAKSQFGSERAFRNAVMGRLYLAGRQDTDAGTLDAHWAEMAAAWPGMFDADTVEGEQVGAVLDALDATAKKVENPYGMNLDGMTQDVTAEVYQQYLDLPEKKGKDAATVQRLLEKLDKAREEARETTARWSRRRAEMDERRAMRGEIIRQRGRMLQKLQSPKAGSFVPYQMREAVEGLLAAIDGKVLTADMLQNAKKAYESVLPRGQDGAETGIPQLADFYNGDVAQAFDHLAQSVGPEGRSMGKLTRNETEMLRDIINSYAAMIANEDRLFMQKRRESLQETGDGLLTQMQMRGERRIQGKAVKLAAEALNRGLLTPTTVFGLFDGTAMEPIWKALRGAEGKHIRNVQEAAAYLEAALRDYDEQAEINKSRRRQLGKDGRGSNAISLTLDSGRALRMTREEAMTIYATAKRERAIGTNHLLGGGITFASTEGRAGQSAQVYQLTQSDLARIVGSLTEKQRAYVDHMVAFLSGRAAEWGNEVTRELYGVEKFREKYYIPFSVDRNYLQSDPAQQQENRLKLGSFTKAVTEKASNALQITPFTELWADHVEKMSDYNAFVLPIEDMTRLMNYRTEGTSVRATMQQRYGTQTAGYVDAFLRRLNGNGRAEHGGSWLNRFIGASKGAAVTFNLSVAIQQAGAAPRAMAEISPKYVLPGILTGFAKIPQLSEAYAEIEEHAPIAVEKGWGYFDTNMSRGLYDRARKTIKGKLNDAGGFLAERGDMFNWVQIWDAVKREVKGETSLEPGTEAYWERCGERFTEVIDKTQVVDSIFQRAEWATEKGLIKQSMNFLSEPIKQYNMLWRGAHTITEGIQTKNRAEVRRGIGQLSRNVGSIAISAVATAALKSLITALRDRDGEKKEKDEDGNTVMIGVRGFRDKYLEALLPNLMDNLTGLLPIFSTMFSDAFTSGYGQGSSTLENTILTNLGRTYQSLQKGDYERALYYALQAGSNAAGVGIGNGYRDARALILTAKDAVERDTLAGTAWDKNKDFDTRVKAAVKNYVFKREKDENGRYLDSRKAAPALYYDLMLTAYFESGMGRDFQVIVQAALDNGATEQGLMTGFKNRLRDASDAVTEAAKALHVGDMDDMNRYAAEIVKGGIGTKAAYSMIQAKEKELYPAEKAEEESEVEKEGKAENVVEGLQEGAKSAMTIKDTSQWSEAVEKAKAGDSGAIADLKKMVEELRKEGYTDKELTTKVWTLYGKDYKAAIWGGDTAAAAALEKAMVGAGVGLTKDALAEKMLDASKTEMYAALRGGDVETAKRMKAYVEKVMGSDGYVKALKQWAKAAYPKAVKEGTGATLKKALLAMGLAESTLDGYLKTGI